MYEKLVKELRELSHEFYLDDNNKYAEEKLKEAADAIEELQKAVLHLEDASGILDELPMGDQSTLCDACSHKGNVDFDYCHICNNEVLMYKPKSPKEGKS